MTARLARWVARLTGYDFKISYVKGKENIAADALSRRSDMEAIARTEIEELRSQGQGERVKLAAMRAEENEISAAVDNQQSELEVNIEMLWDRMRQGSIER